jgi:hypothetical protein
LRAFGAICSRPGTRNCSRNSWKQAVRGNEMARKTDGEKIDELVTVAAVLTERLSAVREEIEDLPGLITRVALLEQQFNDLRNRAEETSRWRWSLVPAIVGAILGGIMTLAGQAVIRHFWPWPNCLSIRESAQLYSW